MGVYMPGYKFNVPFFSLYLRTCTNISDRPFKVGGRERRNLRGCSAQKILSSPLPCASGWLVLQSMHLCMRVTKALGQRPGSEPSFNPYNHSSACLIVFLSAVLLQTDFSFCSHSQTRTNTFLHGCIKDFQACGEAFHV